MSLLHCTLSGTIYLYQSEELGQINMPPSWGHEEYKDVATKNYWKRVYEERKREGGGKGEEPDMSDVMKDLRQKARDNARTPVQVGDRSFFTGSRGVSRVDLSLMLCLYLD